MVAGHDDKGQRPARQQRVVAFSCLLRGHIGARIYSCPLGFHPERAPQRRALWRLPARGAAARALQDSRSLAPHPAAHGGGARYEKTCRAVQRTYPIGAFAGALAAVTARVIELRGLDELELKYVEAAADDL